CEPPGCLLCGELAVRRRHGGSGALQAATQRRRRGGRLPKENLDSGLVGGRLRRSSWVRYPATSVPFVTGGRCCQGAGAGDRRVGGWMRPAGSALSYSKVR